MAKIKITQTGSPIRRDKTQRATLVGLGLNKMRRTVEVERTRKCAARSRKVRICSTRRRLARWDSIGSGGAAERHKLLKASARHETQ